MCLVASGMPSGVVGRQKDEGHDMVALPGKIK